MATNVPDLGQHVEGFSPISILYRAHLGWTWTALDYTLFIPIFLRQEDVICLQRVTMLTALKEKGIAFSPYDYPGYIFTWRILKQCSTCMTINLFTFVYCIMFYKQSASCSD